MNHKIKPSLLLFTLIVLSVFQSCKQAVKTKHIDYLNTNQNKIVVDESLQPIFDEELYVFKSTSDTLHPVIAYAPEEKAINAILTDSSRIAILARDLTADEYKTLRARNADPTVNRFAIDAIALIVNEASTDTTITVSEIKKMLNGDTKKDKNIVFDSPNSALVRYLMHLVGNKELKQKNIYSLKSNKEVIKYVSEHPNAIGITGFTWLNDPDKDYADAVQKVKIVSVKDDVTKNAANQYFTPSQNTLALKQYPLTRDLFIVYNTSKLGKTFEEFLLGDRGQRIILKSGILPTDIPARRVVIEKKFKTKA